MQQEQFTLESIETQALELSQEALRIGANLKALRDKLPSFFNTIKGFSNSKVMNFAAIKRGAINQRAFEVASKKHSHSELRNQRVIVPDGLNVPFSEYLDNLAEVQRYAISVLPDILIPFEKQLAVYLDKPDSLRTQRESPITSTILSKDVEHIQTVMGKSFSNDGSQHRRFETVIPRMSDLPVIASKFNTLKDELSKQDPRQVTSKTNEIAGLLDVLLERMDQYPDEYKASGITISDLARISFLMAQAVEIYGVHVYNVESLEVALNRIVKMF